MVLSVLGMCGVSHAGDASYEELLKRVKSGDETVDYTELRMAYTRADAYDPYFVDDPELKEEMDVALDGGDYARVSELSEKILDGNYLNIKAHLYDAYALEKLGDASGSEFHSRVGTSLIKSVLASGDGTEPASAFDVISVAEEYDVLYALRLSVKGQELVTEGGSSYDKMTVFDTETGKTGELYFCVDLPFNRLGDMLRESEEQSR